MADSQCNCLADLGCPLVIHLLLPQHQRASSRLFLSVFLEQVAHEGGHSFAHPRALLQADVVRRRQTQLRQKVRLLAHHLELGIRQRGLADRRLVIRLCVKLLFVLDGVEATPSLHLEPVMQRPLLLGKRSDNLRHLWPRTRRDLKRQLRQRGLHALRRLVLWDLCLFAHLAHTACFQGLGLFVADAAAGLKLCGPALGPGVPPQALLVLRLRVQERLAALRRLEHALRRRWRLWRALRLAAGRASVRAAGRRWRAAGAPAPRCATGAVSACLALAPRVWRLVEARQRAPRHVLRFRASATCRRRWPVHQSATDGWAGSAAAVWTVAV